MSAFTTAELEYLKSQPLMRFATASPTGRPDVAPVVFEVDGSDITTAGFDVTREQHLQPHYARTLDIWHANLLAHRDEAIAVAGQQIYDDYDKYLIGCANGFRKGIVNLMQFTIVK